MGSRRLKSHHNTPLLEKVPRLEMLTSLATVLLVLSHVDHNFSLLRPLKSGIHGRISPLYASTKRALGTNIGITQTAPISLPISEVSRRRKVGPPQRNGKTNPVKEEVINAGRVSVYCLGAGLDLQSFRAQVSQRGSKPLGDHGISTESTDGIVEGSGVVSSRSVMDEIDHEVLHVSNAPLFINAAKTEEIVPKVSKRTAVTGESYLGNYLDTQFFEPSSYSDEERFKERDRRRNADGAGEDDISDSEWKTKEIVLMATQDIFYFDYGCVVFWGLSSREEKAAIDELAAFTIEPVSPTEQSTSFDTLEYIFDRKANPQRPIRFDRMRLRSAQFEEKMALSYAMAQSSKLFVFESRVLDSVEMTRYLPRELAKNGRIDSSKKALNQQIGELFVEQTEVNLFSSILDTPDFLWENDEHLPAYQYTRSYLEVDDRVALLNSRLAVIRDLLDVLTGQVADNNSTRLEWIVIWLIAVEIVMGIVSNPLFAGKRFLVSMLVPVCIIAYKRINWAKVFKDL